MWSTCTASNGGVPSSKLTRSPSLGVNLSPCWGSGKDDTHKWWLGSGQRANSPHHQNMHTTTTVRSSTTDTRPGSTYAVASIISTHQRQLADLLWIRIKKELSACRRFTAQDASARLQHSKLRYCPPDSHSHRVPRSASRLTRASSFIMKFPLPQA